MREIGMLTVVTVILFVCIFRLTDSNNQNNVCPTLKDYYTIRNNTNCWYNFAALYNVPTIIRLLGYKVIEYKVQTHDGHILTIFRIPSATTEPKIRHPVYLQHGLVSTCANFLALREDSIAIMLADAGYDVWLGNFRGNEYAEEHVNLTVFDKKFWDHSMDEIVLYDFPAIFDTILRESPPNSKIIYIGHSLGTTLPLMFGAEFPEESDRIFRIFILMSPAYTLTNMKSPYRIFAPYGDAIIDAVDKLNLIRIVSQAEPLRRFVRQVCLESPPLMQLCMQLYNLFYGKLTQLGPEMIPVYFNQLPGGTSLKILNHAADLVLGFFRRYNYKSQNMARYGTPTPPIYNISKINVPVYILYARNDWATTEGDAWNLFENLASHARFGIRRIEEQNFNHEDFIMGRHAREIVYEDLIRKVNRLVKNS